MLWYGNFYIEEDIKADEISSTGYNLLIDVADLGETDISEL